MAKYFHVSGAVLQPGQTLDLVPHHATPPNLHAEMAQFEQGLTRPGWTSQAQYLAQPHGADVQHMVLLELLWEYVRRAEFASAPSRFSSVFAWPSLDDARAFAYEYRRGANATIYEVDGTEWHRGNMRLVAPMSPGIVTVQHARAYWQGVRGWGSVLWESLLEPPVTVLSKIV